MGCPPALEPTAYRRDTQRGTTLEGETGGVAGKPTGRWWYLVHLGWAAVSTEALPAPNSSTTAGGRDLRCPATGGLIMNRGRGGLVVYQSKLDKYALRKRYPMWECHCTPLPLLRIIISMRVPHATRHYHGHTGGSQIPEKTDRLGVNRSITATDRPAKYGKVSEGHEGLGCCSPG
ncbi:hypothetical protein NDU88_004199 [Pleurodeles waltl]|uniref:Uncharacterized protein n=1 Tax=Pleurodeles waltl TaxID=8319 RepID=A0AAV7QHP9_PLEWA|nr:hypothetical protein NDU88_004199 [Pleurodeles waltl]